MFSLAPLQEAARAEMRYALQRRDAREPAIHPQSVRRAVAALEGVPSIALAGGALDAVAITRGEVTRALVRTAQWEVSTAFDQFRGYAKVTAAMKARTDGMPRAERREVEEASKILRRLRAGAAAPGPVPLPMPAVRPAERTA
jgi:hypothetical protein